MKVAIVCPYAWDRFGGVQSHIRSLAAALRARGREVLVVAPARRRPPAEDGVAIVGRAVGVPANGSVAPVSFGPIAAAALRRTLRTFDPDIVHLHEPLIPSLSLIALWNARTPSVGTFHAAASSSAGYRLSRPVLARAARRLTLRTAVSEAARGLASTYFPGDFLITPNGVDFERFAHAEPAELGSRRKVLFLSRVEKRKGLLVLIEAMARMQDVGAELVVAGTGPDQRSARRRARELGVPARWLGPVAESDVPRLYRAADAYCAPGLGGESFGIVLVEAMAAGAPVVCSDLPGFREAAAGAAELVRPSDPDALAAALRKVLSDPATAASMRERGSDRAQWFDWNRLVRDVERIYDHAIMRG